MLGLTSHCNLMVHCHMEALIVLPQNMELVRLPRIHQGGCLFHLAPFATMHKRHHEPIAGTSTHSLEGQCKVVSNLPVLPLLRTMRAAYAVTHAVCSRPSKVASGLALDSKLARTACMLVLTQHV